MLVGVWRTWGSWRLSKQLSTHPHKPACEFTPREERRHMACRNGAWLALTERGTSDALVGVDVGRNGWLPESSPGKAPAMRESNGSDIDNCC